jgi:hypothetical protein
MINSGRIVELGYNKSIKDLKAIKSNLFKYIKNNLKLK